MQLTAFGDLNLSAEQFFNGLGKWLTDISAISQNALHGLQISRTTAQCKQCPLAIRYLGCCNGNGVGQTLGVDSNVALDSRTFLPAS